MVTARGAALLVGSGLLWLLGRTLGVTELFVVAVASGALVALSAVAVRLSSKNVALRRRVEHSRLPAGATTDVTVQLRNDARLPVSLLLVEDICPPALGAPQPPPRGVVAGLGPGQSASLRYTVRASSRGRHPLGPLRVRTRDPFGLTERIRRYPSTDEVVVHPRVEGLTGDLVAGTDRSQEVRDARRLLNAGDEFYALREYVTGDDLRHVHWPATAHRGTLMVRQREQPWLHEAMVFCDTRASAHRGSGADSTLEKAISGTASVLCHLAERGYDVRLATDADARLPARAQCNALLDRLADLEASSVDSLAPALSRLRACSARGLLAAVVAPPPGKRPVDEDPDVRALLRVGRGFRGRLGIVVESGSPRPGTRGHELAGLLRAAGWRATALGPHEALAAHWHELVAAHQHPRTVSR